MCGFVTSLRGIDLYRKENAHMTRRSLFDDGDDGDDDDDDNDDGDDDFSRLWLCLVRPFLITSRPQQLASKLQITIHQSQHHGDDDDDKH